MGKVRFKNLHMAQSFIVFSILALPVCHALLRNKQRATYNRLFMVIRDAVINAFGNMGQLHTILMDYEVAAHDAARAAFLVQTLGCTFHFGQCIQRWLRNRGLKACYENNTGGLREWIGLLRSLALLPQDLVSLSWQRWLSTLPQLGDQSDQRKLSDFPEYFEVCLKCKSLLDHTV